MKHFQLYLRMIRYVRPHLSLLAISILLSFCIAVSESLSLWLSSSLLSAIFKPESLIPLKPVVSIGNFNAVLKYFTYSLVKQDNILDSLKIVCIFMVLFFFAKNLFSYLRSLTLTRLDLVIVRDLRNQIFGHSLILPVTYYDRNRSGGILSLMFNDIYAINNSMTGTFDRLLSDPLRLFFFIGVLMIISVKFTLMVFIIYPVLGFLIAQIGRTVKRRSKRMLESISDLASIMHETVNCIRVVKMFNMTGFESNRFNTANVNNIRTSFRSRIFSALTSPLTETLGVFVTAALLWYGGRDVLTGHGITAEDFIRFLTFLFMMFQPLKSLGEVNNILQNGFAGAERVFGLLDVKPERITALQDRNVPIFEKDIKFSDVRFTYPQTETEVIRGVSFSIRKGRVAALVGSSGCGKSTILDLLPRFYEISDGVISIDGIDSREFDLVGLRSLFGIVSQETILFNDTIFNNIAYGLESIGRDRVIAAAQAANALEFIEKMPAGFETVVGEQGVMLSGGQRQRLSIARALLKNPPILILDEATSALDTESERLVQGAINNLMANRTTLMVAHRLSTIAHADTILVIEDGAIAEQGSHAELMQLGKRYKYFYDMQFTPAPHGAAS